MTNQSVIASPGYGTKQTVRTGRTLSNAASENRSVSRKQIASSFLLAMTILSSFPAKALSDIEITRVEDSRQGHGKQRRFLRSRYRRQKSCSVGFKVREINLKTTIDGIHRHPDKP